MTLNKTDDYFTKVRPTSQSWWQSVISGNQIIDCAINLSDTIETPYEDADILFYRLDVMYQGRFTVCA